jgi:protein-disulfide isomerase
MVAPTMDQLLAEYPKDVRVVSKYFVIHGEPAMPSGQGACAAGKQGKYDEYQKAVWKKVWPSPQSPNRDAASLESITAVAGELGLDQAKFKADLEGDCKEWLSRSARTLQQFGAGGTPSFYVNGRFVQAGNAAAFKRVIDEEIKRVDESGVKPADYYEKVVIGQGEKEARMVSPFDE